MCGTQYDETYANGLEHDSIAREAKCFVIENVDRKLVIFYSMLWSCISLIPQTTVTMTTRDKPWITPAIKNLINLRWQAFRTKNMPLYNHYKCKTKEEIRKAKSRWASKCTQSTKNAWKVVNELRGSKQRSCIGNLISDYPSIQDCFCPEYGR